MYGSCRYNISPDHVVLHFFQRLRRMLDVRDWYQAHPGEGYEPFYKQFSFLSGIILVQILLFSSRHKTDHVLDFSLTTELS